MKTLKGISAASGIASGIACLYSTDTRNIVPHYPITKIMVDAEISRLRFSFDKSTEDMKDMITQAKEDFDKEAIDIFHAHLTILQDKEIFERSCDLIRTKLFNAEHALENIFNEYIEKYKSLKGHFGELIHDFIDTRNRILDAFHPEEDTKIYKVCETQPVIIATERLTPSLVLSISRKNALAFISKEGGFTSHATILARSFGVPIVFGIDVEKHISSGSPLLVDGSLGRVIIDPDKKTKDYYEKKSEALKEKMQTCEVKWDLSPRTQSGIKMDLKINISTPEEYEIARDFPHEGIGLLRTEFLFTQRNTPPGEDEQFEMYKHILESTGNKKVTVRLLDIGGDKIPLFLDMPEDADLCMGIRGAIAIETFPELYLTQIKALLRANTGSNLRLLYPMVSDLSDLKTFDGIVAKAKKELKKQNIKFNTAGLSKGVMVETPGAVMTINEILKKVDFINIGSNDLLQYALAASRGNLMVEKHYHILHPALVRFIEIIVKAAKKAKKEVCLCGEISSFEEFYPLLLDTGLRSFSVAVSKFEEIKCALLHINKKDTKNLIKKYYELVSTKEIDKFFEQFV